jgi:hypothetical protein
VASRLNTLSFNDDISRRQAYVMKRQIVSVKSTADKGRYESEDCIQLAKDTVQ